MLVLPYSSSSSSSPTPHDNNTKFKQTKESYGRAPTTYDNHHECCHEKCLAPPQQEDRNQNKTKNASEIGGKNKK